MSARILIAEDDELQGTALRSVLERRGYVAESVTDGFEAVRRLRDGSYDLALLDYHMPEVSGLATARFLHEIMGEEACPRLIAITAAAEELQEKEQLGGERSFDAIVSKRLGLQALLDAVNVNLIGAAEDKATMIRRKRTTFVMPEMRQLTLDANADAPGWASERNGSATAPRTSAYGQQPVHGQIEKISLAAFKDALGETWQRVGLRAMMKAEQIIKRRLGPRDVLSRTSDHSFVIWFAGNDVDSVDRVLDRTVRDIRLCFLMDFGDEVPLASDLML